MIYRRDLRHLGILPKSSGKEIFLDPERTRVGVLDIESSGLAGDFDIVFCCTIKIFGRDEIKTFRINLQQLDLLAAERKMLRELNKYIRGLDGLTTYYGARFDVPMLRTRMFSHGINPFPKIRHLDLYFSVKRTLNTSRRRLQNVIELFQQSGEVIPSKGRVEPVLWVRAMFARDEGAMDAIVQHNIEDVLALEAAIIKLQNFVTDRVLRQ
jgi:uncharacterized protein YprB with RNaseH-like and TPR domain